jgi:hypothetical protein
MTRQLPSRPNLEQLRKQAKSVLKGHQAATPEILGRVREHHPRWRHSTEAIIASSPFTLADAQLVIAAEYGFETWSRLKAHVLLNEGDPFTEATIESLHTAASRGDLVLLTSCWRHTLPSSTKRTAAASGRLFMKQSAASRLPRLNSS